MLYICTGIALLAKNIHLSTKLKKKKKKPNSCFLWLHRQYANVGTPGLMEMYLFVLLNTRLVQMYILHISITGHPVFYFVCRHFYQLNLISFQTANNLGVPLQIQSSFWILENLISLLNCNRFVVYGPCRNKSNGDFQENAIDRAQFRRGNVLLRLQ